MTVSAVNDVPGIGPTLRFESALEKEQDGAAVFTPGAEVAGVLRVHEVDGETFGYAVPSSAVAPLRADSMWVTHPLRAEATAARALKALLDGDCDVAVAHLRRRLEIDPNHPGVATTWWQLGRCLETLGRAAEAEPSYRAAEAAYRREGAFEDASLEIEVWTAIARVQPEAADAWLQLGLLHEDGGDAKAALAAYEQAAMLQPDDVTAHRGVGWARAALGDWAKAWQAFEKAHALDEASAATLYDLALCYHRLGFDAQLAKAQRKLKTLDLALYVKLVAAVGDRTAEPQQVYQAGPDFPVSRIREYWKKPYRITDMDYGDGEWGVVLTRQQAPRPQKYRSDAKIARETWNAFRRDGYALTSLARRDEYWVSTWTKDPAVKSQSLLVVAGFPEKDLNARLAKGLRITSVARGHGMWGFVLSYPSPYSKQIWLRGATVPAEAVQARWKEGYRITEAAYGEGRWLVVLSKDSGLGEQDWVLSPAFPEKDVQARWREGYRITTIARGGGRWLVVLSTETSGG